MEYQDYELQTYERLEKDYNEAEARLVSRQKTLAEVGILAFEGIQYLDFATEYGLSIERSRKEGKAEKKKSLAEQKLRLAEIRFKAAESDLGERVERVIWVRLFLEEVKSAQTRLDKLQRLADDARRDLEPFNRWLQTRHSEWDEFSEEGKRLVSLEVKSAEFQDRKMKRRELEKKEHEAGFKRFRAKEDLEFAQEVLKAAQSDDIKETIERAALIKAVQEEVRSAQTQFEEAKESREKIVLKGKVLSALSVMSHSTRKMERHKILLKWIEQQRREIADGHANIEKAGGQGGSKRASSRVLRNHSAPEPSRLNRIPEANDRKRKQLTARLILGPIDPAKVSKPLNKRQSPRQKISVTCDASRAAEKTTTDSSVPESRSKQAFKVKDMAPASLRPIHSSRVSKPNAKQSTRLHRGGTKLTPITGIHRYTREDNSGTPFNPPINKKSMQQSADTSLRKSTRKTKGLKRFHPDYT